MTPDLSRRAFIRGAALGTVGLPLLLEACSGLAGPSSSPGAPAGATSIPATGPYPVYAPISGGPTPDLHDGDPRYEDSFNHYPANPSKSWNKPAPGAGSSFSVFMYAYNQPPTPRDQNPTWQEVERQLNAKVSFNQYAGGDYGTQLATTMAGNDLPDIIHLRGGYAVAPNLPEFFKAKCADLTPYLGGEASKDYPNLSAIPTYAWKQGLAAIDGHLYLIPLERYLPGTGTLTASGASGYFIKNTDIWDATLGTGYQPKDADDFKRVLQELNRPESNQWALGATPDLFFALYVYAQMFGAPNGWRLESNGALTRNWETPEFKAAVGYLRDLWSAGLYHPDSNGSQPVSVVNGQFVVGYLGFGLGWASLIRQGMALKPQRHFDWILPIAHDGGTPINYLTAGVASLNVLKAGPPDRITELLRIIDWLAAPFGSQEDLLLTGGIKDQDYTLDEMGNPVPTAAGKLNALYVPWQYICQHPQVAYQPDIPGYGKAAWDFEHAVIPNGITDPTWTYYSPTNYGSGTAANRAFHDGMNDIILGRRQLDEYDTILKSWQTAAGEQIRKEFLEAMAGATSG